MGELVFILICLFCPVRQYQLFDDHGKAAGFMATDCSVMWIKLKSEAVAEFSVESEFAAGVTRWYRVSNEYGHGWVVVRDRSMTVSLLIGRSHYDRTFKLKI